MKVSIGWLKELVGLKVPAEELTRSLSLRTIGIKEETNDFIELDMKGYNRADLLSMRGVATEVAAITGSRITFQEPKDSEYIWVGKSLPSTPVSIEDEELSKIQCVAKIEGLKVGTSPKEWVDKLAASGMRSVDNITDITNLIMLEYGQPMHAFDESGVKDDTINVRLAKKSEEIVTLDGKLRKLDSTDIILADSEKPLDVAGVMGGQDTEVKESTTSILLSASLFNSKMVGRTSQRLNFHSEASKRFRHGLTAKRLFQALDGAIRMYQDLGGKLTALTIVGESEDQLKTIQLTQNKINSLLGVTIPPKEVEKYLQSLGFHLEGVATNSWVVTPPYYRLDIEIEEDLIEEVARMYGYEKIPAKELSGELPEKIDQSLFDLIYNLKKSLADAGLTEVQTYSFYSTAVLGALGFNESNQGVLVKIANPISSETEYLKAHLWPNLIEVVSKNLRQGFSDIAIFELGKVYQPQQKDLPKEPYRLAVVLMNGSDNPIQELSAIVQKLSLVIASERSERGNLLQNKQIASSKTPRNDERGGLEIKPGGMMKELESLFHPKRFATISVRDKTIGGLAEVHPRFLNNFGIYKRVAILEIDLGALI